MLGAGIIGARCICICMYVCVFINLNIITAKPCVFVFCLGYIINRYARGGMCELLHYYKIST